MPDLRRIATAERLWAAGALLILGILVLGIDAAASALARRVAGSAGPALVAALGNSVVAIRFGVTLLPGREPLISRYSRFDSSGLPDQHGGYTRRLTAVWAALLGGFALLHAATAAVAPQAVTALSVVEALVCIGTFWGEHAVRNRRFPQHGRATPLRTFRAICLAHRVLRHAA